MLIEPMWISVRAIKVNINSKSQQNRVFTQKEGKARYVFDKTD